MNSYRRGSESHCKRLREGCIRGAHPHEMSEYERWQRKITREGRHVYPLYSCNHWRQSVYHINLFLNYQYFRWAFSQYWKYWRKWSWIDVLATSVTQFLWNYLRGWVKISSLNCCKRKVVTSKFIMYLLSMLSSTVSTVILLQLRM